MSTLYKRLAHFCFHSKLKLIPSDQRQELGKEIIEAFQQSEHKTTIQKVRSEEPDGIFNVISYPSKFTPTIDFIIHNYYRQNLLLKKERKRIPSIRVGYAAKAKK